MIQDTIFNEKNFADLLKPSPMEFEDCEFHGINFTAIDLKRSLFEDCKLTHCNLAGQDLLGANFRDVQFAGCKLMGINWATLSRLENCNFSDCKLDLSSFQGRKLKRLRCINCSLKETDFSEAELTEADFSGSILSAASFVRADLSKANLRSAKGYFIDPSFTKIKGAKFSLPEALTLLVALGAEVEF